MSYHHIVNTIKRIKAEHGLITVFKRGAIRAVDKCLYSLLSQTKIKDNLIIFYSIPDFSDNARVLFEYMVDNKYTEKYRLVWVVDKPRKYQKYYGDNILFVKRHSLFSIIRRCVYFHQKAHWIFHTHGTPFPKRNDGSQVMVSLWHGGMGFKLGKGGIAHPKDDYILISGNGEINYSVSLNFHQCNKEQLLPIGLPRNDLLFKSREIDWIDSYSEIKILWMPTFRQSNDKTIEDATLNSETGFPILDTFEKLHEFNNLLKSLGTILLRISNNLFFFLIHLQKYLKGTCLTSNILEKPD